MLIRTFNDLIKKFDESYPEMTQLSSKSVAEHQSKLDALVIERGSLTPCLIFNCNFCIRSNTSTLVVEKAPVLISNSKKNNAIETPINSTPPKKKKIKKRKIKKDSVEHFVFPQKTARPVSPSVSEPVATINSFSDLEYEEIKDQDKTDEDDDEHHNLRRFLEGNKDLEFFSVNPKPNKPIKVVIKGLPIFTKIPDIQSDLEEDGFTIEKKHQYSSHTIGLCTAHHHQPCYNTKPNLDPHRGWRDLSYPVSLLNVASQLHSVMIHCKFPVSIFHKLLVPAIDTSVYKLSENEMKRDESTEEQVEGELKLGEVGIRETILSHQNRIACCMCIILRSADLER
ncbi:uncharacterized protein TNCV_31821 [Trichonephila clavipes]|nr:uncharacterized protein TNCV_31821 [Trichonephila clavipes]